MKPSLAVLAAVFLLGNAACSSSDDTGGTEPIDTNPDPGAGGSGGGGTVTPPPAENPCGLDTNFAGDDVCIPPPAEGEGFQLHVGPESYDDPDVIGAVDAEGRPLWTMNPGEERTQCYRMLTPNTETVYYFKQQYRMRPGSHHLIIASTNPDVELGWGPCEGSIVGAIGGTQHAVEDYPPNLEVAPEDQGLARGVYPASPLDFQLHYFNATEAPTLREVWVNFLFEDPADVTMNLGMMGGFAPVNVRPHETVTTGSECRFEQAILTPEQSEARVLSLFGHAHAHNTRFAVWKDAADGTSQLVYDNYEWEESPQFFYNTLVQNPVPDPATRTSGASSGILSLVAGERLRFECEITNDLEITLRSSNEVFTGEMCNLFGSFVGPGFPCFDLNR